MALTTKKFITEIKALTVIELNELVKAIEEEFGVSAAAPVAAAGDAGAAPAEAESATKDIMLVAAGGSKLAVIKVIRSLNAELGLKEAKEIADNGGLIKGGIDTEEAEAVKVQLEEAGATVELK